MWLLKDPALLNSFREMIFFLQFLVYFTIEKSHMHYKEKIIFQVCLTYQKIHHLSSFRPGGVGGIVETRLHNFLEIFCHFQNCKANVCGTNGSKVTANSRFGLFVTLFGSHDLKTIANTHSQLKVV